MPRDTGKHEKRVFQRSSCRIPCEVSMGKETHSGFALDVSASGIFVQINTMMAAGTEVKISIRQTKTDSITLNAVVVRMRHGHRSVTVIQSKGVGFEIKNAPEAYYNMLADLQL